MNYHQIAGKHHQVSYYRTRCPECLAPIGLKQSIKLWEPVTCPECHTMLEVTSLDPPTLDYLPHPDWDDDPTNSAYDLTRGC